MNNKIKQKQFFFKTDSINIRIKKWIRISIFDY